jgi:hypothetical protein
MFRILCVTLIGASTSACLPPSKSLLSAADPTISVRASTDISSSFGDNRDDVRDPADWKLLNQSVGPNGGLRNE